MTTIEENVLLTETGPGTPCGEVMRCYWQPAALSEELPLGGAPVPLRLFSEDLVLFRDDQGRPGLLGIHCAHRGADLSYGRIEDGGLRCIYHGWLYDVSGRCLEQPGEPAGSTFHERVRKRAYPCREVGGIIFAYMGPGEPPALPPYEFITAPETHRSNSKVFQECNYLQANEGNLDPVHLSFLHRIFARETRGQQGLNAADTAPTIEAEETEWGVRIYSIRKAPPDQNYVRVTNYCLPNFSMVSGSAEGYTVNWHVPIDDEHHWYWQIRFSRLASKDDSPRWNTGRREEVGPDYRKVRNRANRYRQDRATMKTETFTGLGRNFLPHDSCATEGEGPVQDRTEEHLGATDRGIMAARSVLLRVIRQVQAGQDPPMVFRGAQAAEVPNVVVRNDVLIPNTVDWHNYWDDESVDQELVRA
ncbi:MAG: Aromatic ring-hydroxylating dioxygenase subunit alpha [Chloroflexi bacterium]|nr:Aromatic ring-hydroxylating dioxygenase subunit alpha [Chloroflexota bacterium]